MLYVSRMLNRSRVCVVDTYDGVEEVLTGSELVKCLRDHGLEIKGATLHYKKGKYSVTATPCQPDSTISTFQTKNKLLRGVDVKVSGDTITSIQWGKSIGKPVSIRLSDFGAKCADYVFWWEGLSENRDLTLIFDDKLSATSKSFKYLCALRVKVDLREVTNEKLARIVYKAMADTYLGRHVPAAEYPSLILDRPDRLKFWQVVYHMNNSVIGIPSVTVLCDDTGVAERVYAEYATEFKALSKCPFALVHSYDSHFRCRSYIRGVVDAVGDTDYDYLMFHCFPQILNILEAHSTYNKGAVKRFRNYLHYFRSVPDDIKEAFVSLCTAVNTYLYDEYLRGGLR